VLDMDIAPTPEHCSSSLDLTSRPLRVMRIKAKLSRFRPPSCCWRLQVRLISSIVNASMRRRYSGPELADWANSFPWPIPEQRWWSQH